MSESFLDETPAEESRKPSIDFGESFAFVFRTPGWWRKLGVIASLTLLASALTTIPVTLALLAAVPTDSFEVIVAELRAADLSEVAATLQRYRFDVTPAFYLGNVGAFLLGLAGVALLLGYYIELVRQVRSGAAQPLPEWNSWGTKLVDGFTMEVAYASYLLLNAAFFGVGLVLIRQISGMNAELVRLLVATCCLIPLVFVNGLVIIFITSIGVLPYSATGNIADFYRWGWVGRRLRQDTGLTAQWFLWGLLANFGFSAAQSVPGVGIIGTLASLFMSAPVQGHLLGQYGAALDEKHGDGLSA